MAELSATHKFLWLSAVISSIEIPALILTIQENPFWWMYLFHTFFDLSAVFIVYHFFYETFRKTVICLIVLQLASLATHFTGVTLEGLHHLTKFNVFAEMYDICPISNKYLTKDYAQSCNMYSTSLHAILVLKMLVLGLCGYGEFRRRRVKHTSWDTNPGLVLSSDYIANQNQKGHQG